MKLFKAPFVIFLSAIFISPSIMAKKKKKSKKAKVSAAFVQGEREAKYCLSCHGPQGESAHDNWPNLMGQHKDYLVKQLNDYKSGKRQHELMTPIAKTLSEEEINSVAYYYSKFKIKVKEDEY